MRMTLTPRFSFVSLLLMAVSSGCSDAKPSTTLTAGGSSGAASSAGTSSSGGSPSAGGSSSAGGSGGSGGSSAGGMAAGGSAGSAAGNSNAAGTAGMAGMSGAAGTGGGASAEPGVTKDGEAKLSGAALATVSYGGYLNGEAFQQEGIVTHKGYQYTAFWNTAHHVVMARRMLPSGAWASLEFSDYTNTEADAHNTISLGVTEADGTLHVAFDHHGSPLHYR